MRELAIDVVTIYPLAAVSAYLLHLTAGVLSVGLEEVRRQQAEFLEEHDKRGLALFVLTAGLSHRGEEIEPQETSDEDVRRAIEQRDDA